MKYLLLCLFLAGCSKTRLIVNHPTVMFHSKGVDDSLNGAAVTVRIRWDIVPR